MNSHKNLLYIAEILLSAQINKRKFIYKEELYQDEVDTLIGDRDPFRYVFVKLFNT